MHHGALTDADSGLVLVPRCQRTTTPWDRLRGLLARAPLTADEGLLLDPCGSVHTLFMTYALDLVYLDRNLVVTRVVTALGPWRCSAAWGARMTLELRAGSAARLEISAGRRLRWRQNSA